MVREKRENEEQENDAKKELENIRKDRDEEQKKENVKYCFKD